MRSNNQTNTMIKWHIIAGDFLLLNALLLMALYSFPEFVKWDDEKSRLFFVVCNIALLFSEYRFCTIIHKRIVGADSILKRTALLALTFTLISYLLLRLILFTSRIGWPLMELGSIFLVSTILIRFVERWVLKKLRQSGYNTRTVTLVGSDSKVHDLYRKLFMNQSLGYRLSRYYGDMSDIPQSGSVKDFANLLDSTDMPNLGDELFLCVPREERDIIRRTAQYCDSHFIKFYYIRPEKVLLNLKPVKLDELEVFTTCVSPLEYPANKYIKRFFDIVLSVLFIALSSLLFPFVYIAIKVQSPGPIFFKQLRTGLDGHDFYCYKFRSMHVNADADRLQATKDDPRKYPFGNFMRKANIDELPQFWNVLRGDMSIVGPRPHMLAHTEQYSRLISQYMVRHFVKPGVTGWAQVTGFRGETHELWQMEGRVERDIWYIQNWSIWLDIRIIWMTIKSIFVHDAKAY